MQVPSRIATRSNRAQRIVFEFLRLIELTELSEGSELPEPSL
ncbi:hypothetical protein RMSM_01952 [Rhodopirellula maiorica SM1]|uniref:Uncharacterized protein n=1 Tax=Rhodopirellula maiorica SM1 TaxID=1265738 RepID=M5RPH4_9BACT|nr:hypothetical protein RMSM_01952 [Rhodopirellula maiorica SM1]